MPSMKHFSIIVIFLYLSVNSHASFFRSYQVDDGLSHNSVWAVMQDSKGFVWFGTNDGLNRFDGKIFKVFRKKEKDPTSIGNNFIHCLKEGSQGRFLIGTKEGLYLYNPYLENFSHIDLGIKNGLDVSINTIMEDPDGNIWLGCHGFGLYILNPDLTIKSHYKRNGNKNSIPSDYIWSIVKDYNGSVWIGTAKDGLVHFDSKKETFTKVKDNEELGIADPTIFSLHCDSDNNIWIGTLSEGLYKYNSKTGKVSSFLKNKAYTIRPIIEYSEQELIMGSNKGLIIFDKYTETYRMINQDQHFDNLTDKSIFSIIKDNEGAFWIGTYFGGVNYYSPTINKFFYYSGNLGALSEKDMIGHLAEDLDGKIWIATNNNGLTVFNSSSNSFEKRHYPVGYQNIQCVMPVNDKVYFSVFQMGAYVLDRNSGHVRKIESEVFRNTNVNGMFQTSQGRILFLMENGISYMDSHTDSPKRMDAFSHIPIKWAEEDYTGSLWFASHANGLIRLSKDGTVEKFTPDPNNSMSIPTNNINCVFQDSKYRLWVGTEGGGLGSFNNKKKVFDRTFNEESGFPSNIIYSITDDADGNIWVATGKGLVKIDANGETFKSFNYITNNFQQISYRCSLRSTKNQLYFGGTNGFISFNPKELDSNKQSPSVLLNGFQIFDKEVIPGAPSSPLQTSITNTKEIVLNHNQSTFSFNFVALSYLSPNHNQYAYMLEGFDKSWNYTTSNKAYYMNIPSGKYVFKVKGSNNDDVWSELEHGVVITINPPLWRTNFMIVLYVLLIVGLVAYFIYFNAKRTEKRNQEKLYKFKVEKEKEVYESKIDFFTNIAHEIRTPLSLIIAPLEKILLSGDGNPNTKNNLSIIKINSNRLLSLINQLLDFRKVEENMFHFNFRRQDIVSVVRDVYNQHQQNATQNNITTTLNIGENSIECVVDSEAIYKIVSNLFSNAIKHANKTVDVDLRVEADNLILTVKDDGMGIDQKYQDKIFEPFFQVHEKENAMRVGSGLGLSLSQSLATKHNGKITVESEPNKGTTFMLTIPTLRDETALKNENNIAEKEPLKINFSSSSAEGLLRILVVEDNKDLRTFLASSLGEQNVVFEANDGREALEVVEKENLDIIISDIVMPYMDGLELAHHLKSNLAYSHIPLILLSAKTDTPTKIEGLNKGVDIYLEKPFSIEQLKAQINSIIENRNNLRNKFLESPLDCFPQRGGEDENALFIEKLNSYIIENMSDESFTIDILSEQFFMSRSNFHKKIKNITGITPNDYIKLIRLNQSVQLLSTGKYKINEVCYLVGFNTPSYFSKCFFEHFGKLPKDFIQPKKGGDGKNE